MTDSIYVSEDEAQSFKNHYVSARRSKASPYWYELARIVLIAFLASIFTIVINRYLFERVESAETLTAQQLLVQEKVAYVNERQSSEISPAIQSLQEKLEEVEQKQSTEIFPAMQSLQQFVATQSQVLAATESAVSQDLSDTVTGPRLSQDQENANSKTLEEVLEKVAQHELWVKEEMKMSLGEGTSNEFREEQKAYYDAIQNRVRARSGEEVMFCEIGFNVGHSAVLVLESHPSAKYNGYSLKMDNSIKVLKPLKEIYPGRLEVSWGDSVKTMHENPHLDCDILVVDGGHFFPSAQADLRNMKRFARSDSSILFIDDATCTQHWCAGPTQAWQEAITDGFVVEKRCYKMNKFHGFCQGNYVTAVNPTRRLDIWDMKGSPDDPV